MTVTIDISRGDLGPSCTRWAAASERSGLGLYAPCGIAKPDRLQQQQKQDKKKTKQKTKTKTKNKKYKPRKYSYA